MAGRLSNVATRIMGGNGVVARSLASSLRTRAGMGLPVGKHIVPDKPLHVNDELTWDNGTPFPEPCIDRIADTVGKYEALAWLCGGLSCFVGIGLLAVWNDKASKIPFTPKVYPYPPTDMRPPPGIAIQPAPPGMMVPLLPRPPFGPPPLMMRPPLPPGPPPFQQDGARLLAPQKPSYVKSAASTVIKRPLAQHTPELTSMVPASVRVRRESALPKPKPKSSTAVTINQPAVTPPVVKHESTSTPAPKPQSIDDSYTAFLEDMKALGALEG